MLNSKLLSGDRWIRHLKDDLLKFWDTPEALGSPVGNFPTYRNNDGTIPDFSCPTPEFTNPVPGIVFPDRDHVRAKARQTYAYGVAFHLTGSLKYIDYMQKGLEYLKNNAFDKDGGFFSYQDAKTKQWGPKASQRTSQDLAYALSCFAFYFYLTRDKKTLDLVLEVKKYIFEAYFDKEWEMFRWVLEPNSDGDFPQQKKLVSLLDQIYAYMIWLVPCLSEPYRSEFEENLKQITYTLVDRFYSAHFDFFFGEITTSENRKLDTNNTDFGHSVKAFNMIYFVGQRLKDMALIEFARQKMCTLLGKAYLEESGSWASRMHEDGSLVRDKEWWSFCVLDQAAATLTLTEPYYCRYLEKTHTYWFDYMVDHKYGDVWHLVDDQTNKPKPNFPKQHSWKNAWHTFEHALVNYIVGQQLNNLPATLYFAFHGAPPSSEKINPYFYRGSVSGEFVPDEKGIYKVDFVDIR